MLTASSTVDDIIYVFGSEISSTAWVTVSRSHTIQARAPFFAERILAMKSEGAAAVSLDGKIYLTGGASADPMSYPGAVYYRDLWVFILTVAWRRNFWV